MPDIVSREIRSRMMASIKGRDTKPERIIRKALHKQGFRYRLHDSKLPGKPDLVFSKFRAVVFVHGCFWHGHDCLLFRLPETRRSFWQQKIDGNRRRDQAVIQALAEGGRRRLVVWECAIRGRGQIGVETTVKKIAEWLVSGGDEYEIRGNL